MSKKKSRIGSKKKGDSDNHKLSRKQYEKEIEKLHGELVKLQYWIKENQLKVIVVFEGRDAAGKGGVIKRITERVSPRIFRVVALPAPSEREKTEMYIQRYMRYFPAGGEVVIFDRSWYNRAGVERVMNFCTQQETEKFLRRTPGFERMIVDAGVKLIKYWFDISIHEQENRFQSRIEDPRKIWKLSPMDIESYNRWYDYSRARDIMLQTTDTEFAPWHLVDADNKRKARLNCISHFLSLFPYEDLTPKIKELGKRKISGKYDDKATLEGRNFIPEIY